MAFKPVQRNNSAGGLTGPSSGLARARRATLVLYFPLRAPCPREPLMSNVRPRLKSPTPIRFGLDRFGCDRGVGQLQMHAPASTAMLRAASPRIWRSRKQLASAVRPSAAGGRPQLPAALFFSAFIGRRQRLVQNQESWSPRVGISASRATHPLLFQPSVCSELRCKMQVNGAAQRAWPNPSIERTRKGRVRYARSSFSASRALPSRASHVKR